MSEWFPEEAPNFTEIVDLGNYFADLHNSRAVAAARALSAPEQIRREDGSWPTTECVDCGEDIEPERLAMARVRCFSCQTHKEKKEGRARGSR